MFILHKEMPEGWGILMHGSRIGYRLFGKKAYSIIPFLIDEYRKYACLYSFLYIPYVSQRSCQDNALRICVWLPIQQYYFNETIQALPISQPIGLLVTCGKLYILEKWTSDGA